MLIAKRWLYPASLVLCVASPVVAEPRELLWGDTHVHSANSFDAFLNKNLSATPDVAYRFAQGMPVIHPFHRARMQINRPLDFLVVADHAEYLGVGREVYFNGVPLQDASLLDRVKAWFTERTIRGWVDGDGGFAAFVDLLPHAGEPSAAAKDLWGDQPAAVINAPAMVSKTWQQAIALADDYYQPGAFTTFIGWEWSSLPGGANLHRVVFTSADSSVAATFLPFGSDQSPYPQDLWAWLDETSADSGAEFIAIPHNSNISKGTMFSLSTLRGEPFSPQYLETRRRLEPVVEITQIKGDSETHPALSPRDEFADFETYSFYIQQEAQVYQPRPGDYVRSAMLRGLAIEQSKGVNPYQFGVIGSTDAHTGLATAEESNFGGKLAADSTPETKERPGTSEAVASGWSMSASGIAGVWAEHNNRESIMAAFKRREVYATTGPRIRLRMFAGWGFEQADLDREDVVDYGYANGVAMGGELREAGKGAPRIMVWALQDPAGATLDRLQMIKGWVAADGVTHEAVYELAWAGERSLDADGRLVPVGDTVDRATGKTDNRIGATRLAAVWQDPDFDPNQGAFYYARVLEIPTARHTLLDALALGKTQSPRGASTLQERAYGSPVWYRPE